MNNAIAVTIIPMTAERLSPGWSSDIRVNG
jgi:hypothetical protein